MTLAHCGVMRLALKDDRETTSCECVLMLRAAGSERALPTSYKHGKEAWLFDRGCARRVLGRGVAGGLSPSMQVLVSACVCEGLAAHVRLRLFGPLPLRTLRMTVLARQAPFL